MGYSYQTLTRFILIFFLPKLTKCNYRHFYMENTDICKSGKNQLTSLLEIGTGASIFQLENPLKIQSEYRNSVKRCVINLKAPMHFGLLVYIEHMNLRRNNKTQECQDSVQFGIDDLIPFITYSQSIKFCGFTGPHNGSHFDDPTGNMLIWLNLGGRSNTSYYPGISEVRLTLIVTAYQRDCGEKSVPVSTGFMNCGDRKKCIYQKYRCDKHINCATDNGTSADELNCVYEKDSSGSGGNSNLSNDDNKSGDSGGSALNWISWSLIIVSSGFMTLLFLLMCLRLKKRQRSFCCCCPITPSASCEFPDQPVIHSLAELSNQRHLNPTEQNIYLPLTTFLEQSNHGDAINLTAETQDGYLIGAEAFLDGLPDFPEEPPPAYTELFPNAETGLFSHQETEFSEPIETSVMLSLSREVLNVSQSVNNESHSHNQN